MPPKRQASEPVQTQALPLYPDIDTKIPPIPKDQQLLDMLPSKRRLQLAAKSLPYYMQFKTQTRDIARFSDKVLQHQEQEMTKHLVSAWDKGWNAPAELLRPPKRSKSLAAEDGDGGAEGSDGSDKEDDEEGVEEEDIEEVDDEQEGDYGNNYFEADDDTFDAVDEPTEATL
eukprot:m.44063 g.44063  ORF g.44063 m.44063 type:complete len:172 (+) comp10815_c0_seq1:64-579(+)